jgi:superoxide reductase
MVDAHYIMAIELVDGDTVYRQFLKPGLAPEAFFPVTVSRSAYARELCNLHGLWKG